MYYCNSRYYNPEWGRFINADALAGKVGQLLSHNMFAYCGNNPVVRIDPSGHCWWLLIPVAMLLVEDAPEIEESAEELIADGYEAITSIELDGQSMSLTDYESICSSGTHNAFSSEVMLGKFPSYVEDAKDCGMAYFDLGDEWGAIQEKYGYTDEDMFQLFNEPFLDDGINNGKTFYFSSDPEGDTGALGEELNYLTNNGYIYDAETMTCSPG